MEEFKEVLGFPFYQISTKGTLLKLTPSGKKAVSSSKDYRGYLVVSLINEDGPTTRLLHRLVGEHFIKEINDYSYLYIKNSNYEDCSVENLTFIKPSFILEEPKEDGVWQLTKDKKYWVSNLGKVYSCYTKEEVGLYIDTAGYYNIGSIRVHSLVAECFLEPKPKGRYIPNHKDGNKLNNNSSNLEWATYSNNLQHAYDTGLRTQKKDGSQSNCRSVLQCDYDGNILNEYAGARVAERATGVKAISMCIGKRKGRAGGFVWRYKDV